MSSRYFIVVFLLALLVDRDRARIDSHQKKIDRARRGRMVAGREEVVRTLTFFPGVQVKEKSDK
jgi:hypothetical protein